MSGSTLRENRTGPQTRHDSSLILKSLPYALALFFLLWSLRGVGANNIIDTDAARHAMNGSFILDLIREGKLLHPIAYGKEYYADFPALSLPFHPPLFPAIESLFFAVFGVNVFAARLAVALAVAISVLLFYRLILATHGSRLLAILAIATFCLWRHSRAVASDVMLEFPALVFTLAALYMVRDLDTGKYPLRRGLAFALLAGAAVWTKQHAVFLGLVPWFIVLFTFRWRLLLQKTIWVSSIVFGVQVIGLSLLALPFRGTGVDQVAPANEIGEIFTHNLRFYLESIAGTLGLAPAILLGLCIVAAAVLKPVTAGRQRPALYWSWALSAFTVLLLLGPFDERYLFFVYPALAVIAYASLFRLASMVFPGRLAWYVPVAVGAYCIVMGLMAGPFFLSGPAQSAALVVSGTPQRVLYCGSTDGNFIFAVRTLDPQRQTTVIPGDKLPEADLSPANFEAFARRYSIDRIVIEDSTRRQACEDLLAAPTASMHLEHRLPLNSSSSRWRKGSLSLYKLTHRAPVPAEPLEIPVPKIGQEVQIGLK
ncbi:MAG: glycosyltransferase family 39 protein [Bryobacterales bacterium]|nr:glycosyltransferase family 39 protein [Bryobacterales bacterium]